MKKFLAYLVAAIIIVFSINTYAASDSIDSIDIKAMLMDDGSLIVSEVWKARAGSGTEFYIPKSNMRDIIITDFKVSDEIGPYETIENWNVDASFDEKARKCGINETADGLELCFGKSELNKDKTYTLSYKMLNAAQNYEDMDGFNIRFVNDQMNPAPEKVSFELSLDGGEITEENARVWGFGSSADIVFENGKVVVHEIDDFGPANHLTVLFGLNKDIIHPISVGSGTFEDLKSTALEGSDYYSRDEETAPEYDEESSDNDDFYYPDYNIGNNFNNIIFARNPIFLPVILIFIASIISMIIAAVKKSLLNSDSHLPKDVNYYRDLPLDGDIMKNSYIYSKVKSFSLKNVVAAYFLKWIKDGNIEVIKEKFTTGLIFKRDVIEDCFTIVKEPKDADLMEKELFTLITRASGDDLILRDKELTKEFGKGNIAINFVDRYKDVSSIAAKKANLITEEKSLGFIKYEKFTDIGRTEAINQKGFIKFLKDFTLINEREAVEVALWDEYLVLAALFGIGEKVLEKFKDLDPSYTYAGYSGLDPLIMYRVVNHVGSSVNNVYNSHVSSSSASHGGGGSMSFGGGGGFSGGGSGGGGR